MKTIQKKEVENLQGFILSIVGIAVVLAVGLIVLQQLANQTTAGTYERNATNAIASQLGTVPNWIGILITVALAFIVLGYFYSR
jgi:ABC-type antimicrobial peptide transport system permease subunit